MKNFKSGACLDTRTEKEKEKDYNFDEIVASSASVEWKEKQRKDWRIFPDQNQGASGSCVFQSIRKLASITLWLKEKTYVPFSGVYYQLRSNRPAGGMHGVEAFEIWRKNGLPLEQLVPSEMMTDAEIDAIVVEQYNKDLAKVFAGGNHIGINSGDFEKVASTIQQTGKGIMVWFYFNAQEWSSMIPTIFDKSLNLYAPNTLRHSVVAVDYFLFNGKKYLLIEDSAHFGGITKRLISEEFFRARNFFARYPMSFKFQENENEFSANINLTKDLYLGVKGNDVIILQDLLKELGFFPINTDSTGFYGSITMKAVRDFQLAKGIILKEDEAGAGRCGPRTREYINKNY